MIHSCGYIYIYTQYTYVAIFKMENDDQAPEMLFFPSIRELLAQVHCAEPRLGPVFGCESILDR